MTGTAESPNNIDINDSLNQAEFWRILNIANNKPEEFQKNLEDIFKEDKDALRDLYIAVKSGDQNEKPSKGWENLEKNKSIQISKESINQAIAKEKAMQKLRSEVSIFLQKESISEWRDYKITNTEMVEVGGKYKYTIDATVITPENEEEEKEIDTVGEETATDKESNNIQNNNPKKIKKSTERNEETEQKENFQKRQKEIIKLIQKRKNPQEKTGYIMSLLKIWNYPDKDSKEGEARKSILWEIAKEDEKFANSQHLKIIQSILESETNFNTRKTIQYPTNFKEAADEDITNIEQPQLSNYLKVEQEAYKSKVVSRYNEILTPQIAKRRALGLRFSKGQLTINNTTYNLLDAIQKEWKNERKYQDIHLKKEKNGSYTLSIDKQDFPLQPQSAPTSIDDITNISQYTWFLELGTISPSFDMIKTLVENQKNNPSLTDEEKSSILTLLQVAQEKVAWIEKTKYQTLINTLNNIQTNEQIKGKQESLQAQAIDFLAMDPTAEQAEKLFWDKADRKLSNQILRMVKDNKVEGDLKNNIVTLVKNYLWGRINELDQSKVTFETIQKSIKTWNELPNRPDKYKWEEIRLIQLKTTSGKNIEIFPWKIDDIHEARAIQTIESEVNEDKDTLKDGLKKDINQFITDYDEKWSYMTFKHALEQQDANYLKTNLQTILDSIKDHPHGIEWKNEKINGYYGIITWEIKRKILDNPKDIGILQAYLSIIRKNQLYIGTDKDPQLENRKNILSAVMKVIAKNPEEFKKIQEDFNACKDAIDPENKVTMITQIADNIDKFFETFGPHIAKLMERFGYSKADILKKLPKSVRAKFLEQFQEMHAISAEQKKNYHEVLKGMSLDDNDIDEFIKLKDKADEENKKLTRDDYKYIADKTINRVKQDNNSINKITTSLTNNFTLLSPWLVSSLFKKYKKDNKDTTLKEDTFILNGKIRDDIDENDKSRLISLLTDKTSPIWTDIKSTHNQILENKSTNLWTKEEPDRNDINGTKEDRFITSPLHVGEYIAAYAVTFDKPPFHHAMAENNLNIDSEEPKEKTDEEKSLEEYNSRLAKITNILKDGKYTVSGNQEDLPTTYPTTGLEQYENDVLKPLQELLSTNEFDNKKNFDRTTTNSDILKSLETRPQVLKDLLTYIAKDKTDPAKAELTKLADKFMNDTSPAALESIESITEDNWTLLVTINDTKKLTIKPGPEFTMVEEETVAEVVETAQP